jgi:hypothetical protein
MHFFIPLPHKKIMDLLRQNLDHLHLTPHIAITEQKERLTISFAKFGESHVTFERESTKNGTTYRVIEEKVALLHRPLRLVLQTELKRVVKQFNGYMKEKE